MFSSFASHKSYSPTSAVKEPIQISFTSRYTYNHRLTVEFKKLATYTAKQLIEHIFDYGLLPEKSHNDDADAEISTKQLCYLEYFSKQLNDSTISQLEISKILDYMGACLCKFTEKTTNYSWAISYLKKMMLFATVLDTSVKTIQCREIALIMSCNLVKFCKTDQQLYQLFKKEIINKMFSWVNHPDIPNINTIRQALLYITSQLRLNNTIYENVLKLTYSHTEKDFFSDEFIFHRVFYYLISRIVFENTLNHENYYQHKIKSLNRKRFNDYLFKASQNDPNWEVQKVFKKLFKMFIAL